MHKKKKGKSNKVKNTILNNPISRITFCVAERVIKKSLKEQQEVKYLKCPKKKGKSDKVKKNIF